MKYEMVCGIETHVELATDTKIFCGCTTKFGGAPNTHCCPICTGQPGTMPVLNKKVVELAVKAGLALNCTINNRSHMDRKNYFYPDLPKAYQISQFDEPLCENGFVKLDSGKKIGITRIHIEEDAGKLVHEAGNTYIDYNRGGVPLIEIVSEPDIRTPEEAKEYAEKLQIIMRYAGVSDCKMQEGSMRCDVNVSLHFEGTEFGNRTEIKNINSLSNIVKAINAEVIRQEKILNEGGNILQATMRYDADKDVISVMRVKENSGEYRFFREPDIPAFYIPDEEVERIRNELPELPDEKKRRYVEEYGISSENASQIYRYKRVAEFFEKTVMSGGSAKNTSNLIIRAIYSVMKCEDDKDSFDILLLPEEMAKIVKFVDERKLNFNNAVSITSEMSEKGGKAEDFVKAEDLAEISDEKLLEICREAVENNPKAVADIVKGKEKAINVIFGFVMRTTKGKADVKAAEKMILKIIAKSN